MNVTEHFYKVSLEIHTFILFSLGFHNAILEMSNFMTISRGFFEKSLLSFEVSHSVYLCSLFIHYSGSGRQNIVSLTYFSEIFL